MRHHPRLASRPRPWQPGRLAAILACLTGCADSAGLIVEAAANPAAAFAEAADPALASEPGSGALLTVFLARGPGRGWQLYFSRTADGGTTWTALRQVTTDSTGLKPQGEASPRLVAAPGGRLAVVWVEEYRAAGRPWPASRIRVSRSLDGGLTWSAARTLNDDTTATAPPGSHLFHGAAWQGDSGLVVAWLDERRPAALESEHAVTAADPGSAVEADATIYTVASPDFGASWGPNRPRWGAVCPCCRVTLAREPDGAVSGAWRRHFPGDIRDVVTAVIPEDDLPPPAPERVHDDGWVYPGCPYTGPALAVGPDGVRHVAWYSGREGAAGVYLARDREAPVALIGAATLPSAHSAVLPLAGGATLAAWDIAVGGEKRLSVARVAPGATTVRAVAVPGGTAGTQPQLAAHGPDGAFLLWTRRQGDTRHLGVVRIRLGR